jgi:hypothetical protein
MKLCTKRHAFATRSRSAPACPTQQPATQEVNLLCGMDRMVNCTECHHICSHVLGSFMTCYYHYPFACAHSLICDTLAALIPRHLSLTLTLRALSRSRWIHAHNLGTESFGDIRDKGPGSSRTPQEQHATARAIYNFHEIALLMHAAVVHASQCSPVWVCQVRMLPDSASCLSRLPLKPPRTGH